MNTYIKGLIGGVIGAFIIAIIFFITIIKPESEKLKIQYARVDKEKVITPVVKTRYLTPASFSFTKAAEKSVNAVVHIKTIIGEKSRQYDNYFGSLKDYLYSHPRRRGLLIAFGSGVIISPDGYIVTNNHVVEGADKIKVTFNDKREMTAKVIGVSPSTDLALIKVNAKNLPYLKYGNSDNLKLGQWVLAVGNPFNLTSTVTAGIISAKARDIHILGGTSSIESFIQTDAAVNPGNSGGALVNTSGQLIGINAAIASKTGAYEGYSFAIPVNLVKKVVNDLMKYGQIQRAYLGIQIRDIDAEFAKSKGLKDLEGVYVANVINNGGASQAGLKDGDIITSLDNKPVKNISEFMGIIGQYSPGNKIKVSVLRGNRHKSFEVTLKNKNGTLKMIKNQPAFFNNELGAMLKPLSGENKNPLGLKKGLQVTKVENGILRKGGIGEGFIITKINDQPVSNKNELNRALHKNQKKQHVVILKGIYPNGMMISFEFIL